MADPTTLLGTIAALSLRREDREQERKQLLEEDRQRKKYEATKILPGGYTDMTDWNAVERPRTSVLGDYGNNYLSQLAISGDDFLKYQARLNPNRRFTGPIFKPTE